MSSNRYKCSIIICIVLYFFSTYNVFATNQIESKSLPRTLKAASESDYPPFAIVKEDGTPGGFSVELLEAVSYAAGFDIKFKVDQWHKIKGNLIDGEIDVLPLVSYSKERDKVLDFTTPYLRLRGTIFVREGEKNIRCEADLKDKEVLVMRGDTAHKYALNNKISDHIILTDTFADAMTLLSEGKHDAVIMQQLVGIQLLKKIKIKNIVDTYSFIDKDIKNFERPLEGLEQKFCIAVTEGDKVLLARLNEGLAIVISNGIYDDLYNKWLGPVLPKYINTTQVIKYILMVILPVLFIFGAFGIWFLKREVTLKTEKLTTQIQISEKTKAALRERETQLRTLIETLPDMVWLKDQNGVYLFCNPKFERFFGAKEIEIIGKTDYDFIDKELADFFRQKDKNVMKANKPIMNEEEVIFADDGHKELLETIKAPVYGTDNNFIGVMGVARDITVRKQIEEALRESEQRYMKAQRLGQVGNWEYNIMTEIFWGSDEAKRIYGFDPQSEKFTTDNVENCIPEREKVHQALIDLIEKNKPYNLEFEIHPVTGPKSKIIKSIAELIKNDLGQPHKVIGVIQDITQQKNADEKNKMLERKLQQSQKMETIGTLAGGIAHDFNNILFPIFGHTEILIEDTPKNNIQRESLEEILSAALRARDLVKQILTFARQGNSDFKSFNIQPVVKEAIKLIRSTIPTTIKIKQDIENDCGMIKADQTQIHQVIMNLATNAYHAMEERGGELTINLKEIELSESDMIGLDLKPGSYVYLTITDTGIGMDKYTIEKAFDPFFTTKKSGKGTGMGLSVVHGIVKNSGGIINIYSEIGQGSQFSVYLPIVEHHSEQHETQVKEVTQHGTEKILLVDDEISILKMEKKLLEGIGYKVITCDDSFDALEIFRATPNKFDMVITDMTMPNMSGEKLATELIKIRPDIPILICTGFSGVLSEKKALDIGVKGFLMKPIVKIDLSRKIREVLDN